MRYDELSIRMKEFEALTTKTKLMPQLPLICRIDGRAFHTFTRGLMKPFCGELIETMQEVCKYLVDTTNAKLGYVQSDEISLCWLDPTKAPFDGKLFKLQSVLSSMATSKFINVIVTKYYNLDSSAKTDEEQTANYINWEPLFKKCQSLNPSFDCRVFQVPNEKELANYFVWREIDAVRNSVQMVAQANFSHKTLQGLDTNAIQNKLLTEKDINWNNLDSVLKRGTYFQKENYETQLSDEVWNKIPDDKKPESRMVIRSRVLKQEFPIMKKVENKVGVYFYKEEPKFKKEK